MKKKTNYKLFVELGAHGVICVTDCGVVDRIG